jgi:HEAT repeat protein
MARGVVTGDHPHESIAMPLRQFTLLLAAAVLTSPLRAAEEPGRDDVRTLRAAGLGTDGPALLAFFRSRTRNTAEPARLAALVRQLGDASSAEREKAAGELVALGPVAVPSLRQAARDPDERETTAQARRCLDLIEGEDASTVPAAAARLLALRHPDGAAEALLAYLPFADDGSVLDEVRTALASLAGQNGKPDPALVRALADPLPLRRAAAAEALCHFPGDQVRRGLRKILLDPNPIVRLRAALALARTDKDPKAVSTLITLLADVPLDQARQAEEYLQELAGDQAPQTPLGDDSAARARCRDAWAAWWLATEGPGLLDEITRHTLSDDRRRKALRLIDQLGDDEYAVRQRASAALEAMGPPVALLLRQHAHDADLEVGTRARALLAVLDREKVRPLSAVTVRLAALRRPPGAAAALLAFLPFAEDEAMAAEVQSALAALAVRDGKPEPALLAALDDPEPLRRAVAGAALVAAGLERPQARRLLQDRNPRVRLRVALALAAAQEKDAVPVLIDLLGELPPTQAGDAEDYLRRLAGERAPAVSLGSDAAGRQKCRDAWAAWWHEHEATAELPPPAASRLLGYTLIIYMNPCQVVELGADHRPRWEIDNLAYSYDAQPLPGDRVLVAEFSGGRVTERTARNEVVWEKAIAFPISCRRLPNGHTLIAARNELVEVDRGGKQVWSLSRPRGDLLAGDRLRDGTAVCVTQDGTCRHFDAAGKELRSFPVGQVILGGMELLPGGHVLVAQYNNNHVVEYDLEGRTVWEAQVATPTGATRLPNGNTLVASQVAGEVQELDRAGKVVWEYKSGRQPWKARRR